MACALFAAVSGSSPATVVAIGSIMLPAMVKAGFPKGFGAGVITTSGALGDPDPAVHRDGDVFGGHQHLGWRLVHGRRGAGPDVGQPAGAHHWRARKFNYPRLPKASWGERWKLPSANRCGACC
jgi:C4-dicarboxylate transporter DctM subunit